MPDRCRDGTISQRQLRPAGLRPHCEACAGCRGGPRSRSNTRRG